jgi:hypothetical protein
MSFTIFTLEDTHVIFALVISPKIQATVFKSGGQLSPTTVKAANNTLLTAHLARHNHGRTSP